VDVSADVRRRLKIAAAGRDLSVTDYVRSVLEQALVEEGPAGRRLTAEDAEALDRLQAAVMRGRHFTDD